MALICHWQPMSHFWRIPRSQAHQSNRACVRACKRQLARSRVQAKLGTRAMNATRCTTAGCLYTGAA